MSTEDYYSAEWYRLQDHVLASAQWVCADCGWKAVVAHHLTYEYGVICPPEYLVALCQQCHKVRHGLSNWQREHYKDWKRRMGYVEVQEWGPGVVFVYGHGYWKFAEPAGSIVSIGSPRGAALIAQGIAVLAEPPPDIESSARNR